MIKFLNAATEEIDDPNLAVKEVIDALDLSKLKKNSVGIITCYSEFIDSGVVKLLAKSLPFDILGATTLQNAVDGREGTLMLTLTVLTSDEAEFSVGLSKSIFEGLEQPISEMYKNALTHLSGKPDLMLSFIPLIPHVCGDDVVNTLSRISGDVPNFGTVTIDHTRDYTECCIIHNGDTYKTETAVLLIKGASPEFKFIAIPDNKIQKRKAIITGSSGSLLKEVNGIKISEYLESLGLNHKQGINVIPFVVDYNDGTKPAARAIYGVTPEGFACGGEMPMGATLGIGTLGHDDVVSSTRLALEKILSSNKKINGMLFFSCIGRNFVLGTDYFAESKIISEMIDGKFPYMLYYSGGEVCPANDKSGKQINRYHNYTMVICVL